MDFVQRWTRAVTCAAALAAQSCDSGERVQALVYVENDARADTPEYLLFSWLICGDFIRRDERVPETGALPRSTNPIATIRMELDAPVPTKRGVLIRGMVGETAISSGVAVMNIEPGTRNRATVRLFGGAVPDGASASAMIDWCNEPADAGPGPPDSAPEPTNQPPVVNAGPDQNLPTTPAEAMLTGTATDDGLPAMPGRLALAWSQVSGPAAASFTDTLMATTRVRFPVAGDYLLRLTASDGAASASDEVAVSVANTEVGLVGHWPLDEAVGDTTADVSGGGNPATLQLGASLVAGRVGAGALDVSGDMDLALVKDPADERLDFGTGDFSVSFWVKTVQQSSAAPDLIVKWPSNLNPLGPRSGFAVTSPGGTLLFKAYSDNGPTVSVVGPTISDGAWHHVAARKTATELSLFLDGRAVGTRAHTLGSLSNTAPLQMGGFGNSGILEFDGQLDEVRLYSRALSTAEITALASVPGP